MSTRYLVLIGLIAVMVTMTASARGAEHRWGQWQNSLKPKGEPAAEIVLAVGGETDYVIVIPASPTTQEQKAAEELQQWLGEMTGAEFPVVSDAQPPREKEISVGRTTRVSQAGLPIAKEDLGDEGYAIAVKGDRLFLIGGRKRGPIYAVLALLEEDLGCRWYTSKGVNRIPRRPTVRVKVVPRSYVPALQIRDPYYRVALDATWSLRNRTNHHNVYLPKEWGGHMRYGLWVHSFNTLISPSQYKADHPEYFGSSQPCLTNPDVLRIVTESVLRILRANPDWGYNEIISVSQNDGGGYCTCEKCQALDRAEGSHAGTLISFVNQVAEAVEKEFPDVLISTLVYTYTMQLPKTVRPRENIAILLCTDTCMWERPFTSIKDDEGPVPLSFPYWDLAEDPSKLSCKGFLDDWSGVHDTIHIWDYVVNYSHYLAPMPNMDVIGDNIRYFGAHNVKGIMTLGARESPGGERDLMRAWVIAKLLWDPSRDVWELMQDFIWGYYGKAAPAIVEYNQLLRRTAEEHKDSLATISGGIRYPMDAEFLSEEFLEGAEAIFARANKLAENEEILHRVELAHLPITYVKISRGPAFLGDNYLPVIDEFERIARREGITHTAEGPENLDQKLKEWRRRSEVRIVAELARLRDEVSVTTTANTRCTAVVLLEKKESATHTANSATR